MHRPWLVWTVVSCASLLACQRKEDPPAAPPPAEPVLVQSPRDWIAEAPGGRATIRQASLAGGCRLNADVSGATPWVADTCAGSRDDLRFVSPDGERLLVLYPLPADVRGKDWSEAIVARVFVRGREERRWTGADLVAPHSISDMSHDFSWVKGVGSGGGPAPRYGPDGRAVILDVVDGARLTLGFDGSLAGQRPTASAPSASVPLPAPAPSAAPPRVVAADSRLWRWEDGDGSVRYSHWDEIPPARRRHAEPVTATVGSVAVDPSASSYSAGYAQAFRSLAPAPDPKNVGPRLNGLTDAERHEQEMARLRAEEAKNQKDAVLYQRQRELERAVDAGRATGRWR